MKIWVMLHEGVKQLVYHEQKIVQNMYEKPFFTDSKTVGEILNDANFLEKLIANNLQLAGAKILDIYISTDGYDMSNYEDRMAYFDRVFDQYFEILSQEGGWEKLVEQRESMVASLDAEYISYGEHFQEFKDTVALSDHFTIDVAPTFENLALTWDQSKNIWRPTAETDVQIKAGGIWTPVDTHPDVMQVFAKNPLILKTFYADNSGDQFYLFSTDGFLPNLPTGYNWSALKTYLQPADSSGYEVGGSLWKPVNVTTSAPTKKIGLVDIIGPSNDFLNEFLNKQAAIDKAKPSVENKAALTEIGEAPALMHHQVNWMLTPVQETHTVLDF